MMDIDMNAGTALPIVCAGCTGVIRPPGTYLVVEGATYHDGCAIARNLVLVPARFKAVSDQELIEELAQFAASHSKNGEARTADLLRRAAHRITKLSARPEARPPEARDE